MSSGFQKGHTCLICRHRGTRANEAERIGATSTYQLVIQLLRNFSNFSVEASAHLRTAAAVIAVKSTVVSVTVAPLQRHDVVAVERAKKVLSHGVLLVGSLSGSCPDEFALKLGKSA